MKRTAPLPVTVSPYHDETFYSWTCRLAKENGLSISTFREGYFAERKVKECSLCPDVRSGAGIVLAAAGMEDTMKDAFLSMSTFPFESMAMTPDAQTRYINGAFRKREALNPPTDGLYTRTKICPECVGEDIEAYGEAYLHRSHQLTGVCACHKHETPLFPFEGIRGHECGFNMDDYKEEEDVSTADIAYARYAAALLHAEVFGDAYTLKRIVFDRMEERGYIASDDYEGFLADFEEWEHSGLWDGGDMVRFLKVKLITAKTLNMGEMLPVLMFLYPDADELIGLLCEHEPVVQQYTCPECGETYCATPKAKEDDWGCPECERQVPPDIRFKHLVNAMSDGDYVPDADFKSMDSKIPFVHKTCGQVTEIKPRAFLFEGVRCKCENTVTMGQAKKAVEANKGFELVNFYGTNEPVEIKHTECGRIFTCRYHKFLRFPGCRACNPPHMTTVIFKERVKALTGGEYTVVGKFIDQDTKIAIRHTGGCGGVQEYKPSHFLDGQRCKKCSELLPHKDLEEMLAGYANGRYKITQYGKNICTVHDTETDKDIILPPPKVAQEITRPTPSDILAAKDAAPVERTSAWDKNFYILSDYRAEYGTTDIPKRAKYHDFALGLWCQRQRDAYRAGKLSKEHTRRLEGIGFVFDPLEEEWGRMYQLYGRFVKKNGSPQISRRTDFEGEHLGAWVDTQKKRYREGKMPDRRKERLLLVNPKLFDDSG